MLIYIDLMNLCMKLLNHDFLCVCKIIYMHMEMFPRYNTLHRSKIFHYKDQQKGYLGGARIQFLIFNWVERFVLKYFILCMISLYFIVSVPSIGMTSTGAQRGQKSRHHKDSVVCENLNCGPYERYLLSFNAISQITWHIWLLYKIILIVRIVLELHELKDKIYHNFSLPNISGNYLCWH